MKNKKMILIAIICISFVQMATNGISSIIADICTYYPEVSTSTIQLLMTFPSLFIIIFSIISAQLSSCFGKKNLIMAGLVLVCISGGLSFVFYESLLILFICAGILGIGVGLCASLTISLIADYFNEKERGKILGWQTSASNAGSMIMTFFGGILALFGWRYNYLIYFIAIPGLLITALYLPNRKNNSYKKASLRDVKYAYPVCALIILFMVLFYIGPTSVSLLISEKGFGDSSMAGTAATVLLLGGTVVGMIFDKVNKYFDENCFALGFLALFVGYICMYLSNNIWTCYIGCFVAGSSVSLVMPKCMFQISMNGKKDTVSFATALAMASSNVGTLIAPFFTVLVNLLIGETTSGVRLMVAAFLSGVITLIAFIYVLKGKNKYEYER